MNKLYGLTAGVLVNVGVEVSGLVGAAVLSAVTARQISMLVRQVERSKNLIDELTVHDPQTGLVKWPYAIQTLRSEIARGRLFQTGVSLLLMRVVNWQQLVKEHGADDAEALMVEVTNTVSGTLRTVDTAARYDDVTFGVILPETSAEGAMVAAQRLIDAVIHRVRVPLYTGVAAFPEDAVTDEDLVAAAEAAVHLALTSGRSVVQYGQLRYATDGEGVEDVRPTVSSETPLDLSDRQSQASVISAPLDSSGSMSWPADIGENGSENSTVPQGAAETQVRFVGLHQIARLQGIKDVLRAQPAIDDVTLIGYDNGILTVNVKHDPMPLLDLLQAIPELLIEDVRGQNGLIKVCLEGAGPLTLVAN